MRGGWSGLMRGLALVASLLLTSCEAEQEPAFDCSPDAQKAFVQYVMSTVYLWADRVPEIDIADYATPAEVLEAMAYREVDRWSGVIPLKPYVDYFEHGETFGFGYSTTTETGELRVNWVVQSAPAGQAGMRRGDTILGIGGYTIAEIEAEHLWETVLGPNERGTPVVHRVRHVDGEEEDLTIEKDVVAVDRVPVVKVFPDEQGNIGYVLFMGFVGPSEADLRAAFELLREQDVKRLIVDLRYNGGGYVWIAGLVGSLIGGPEHAGEILLRNAYNPDYADWDGEMRLTDEPEAISAEQVIFLTSGGTASASELLINGLKPFMDVKLVGGRTYGKPVGADAWQYCDNVVSPITFRSLNALGEGDYFQGIPVDCEVADDLDHMLGDERESRLQAALALMAGEGCLKRAPPQLPRDQGLDIDLARQRVESLIMPEMGGMQ
jgi:C-terminal processing protease CtpA/Prc